MKQYHIKDNLTAWIEREKYNISTIGAAIISAVLPELIHLIPPKNSLINVLNLYFSNPTQNNYFIQFLFIFVTLILLFRYKSKINRELIQGKEHIIKYINKNCYHKIKNKDVALESYNIVKTSVRQFYTAWIVVWILWLVYYLGNFLMGQKTADYVHDIFSQLFDFLTSTAMLFIYLILTNITLNIEKRRNEDDRRLWYGLLMWVFIFVILLVLLIKEGTTCMSSEFNDHKNLSKLMLSVFSSMTFVLVLGKMNSHYLHIPRFLMFGMYIYAIVQAYIPFQGSKCMTGFAERLPGLLIPYMTLLGKVFVMLTLYWIVKKKRLIFFVIHRSNAIEMTKSLLSELDQEPVSF